MERLTDEAWRNLDPWECCGQDKYCKRDCHEEGGCANGCIVPRLYRKLAMYEDTDLTPEDYSFNKEQLRVLNLFMEQIADAEEAVRIAEARRGDRLVILPCKVGDMVYYRRGSYIIGDDVKRIVLDGIDNQVIIDHNHSFMFSDFGRKVWSSRDEAEAVLKGETNGSNL